MDAIPKLKIYLSKPEQYLPVILRFLNPKEGEWNWEGNILAKHPLLKGDLEMIKDKRDREELIVHYFNAMHHKKFNSLKKSKRISQQIWNKLNDKYMHALTKVLGIGWPKRTKTIKAFMTLNPICPRDLENKSFQVYYGFKRRQFAAIAMHEIFHFLYFEKLKYVFRNRKQMSDHYLSLHLSEIAPYIVLNSEHFQKILRYKHKTYKEYHSIDIRNTSLINHIKDLYSHSANFSDFLIKADKFMWLNRRIIRESLKN